MVRTLLLAALALLLTACQSNGHAPTTAAAAPVALAPTSAAAPAAALRAPATEGTTASASGDAQVNQTIARLLGDPAPYRHVFDALQQAVASQDGAAVAALVDYPITLTVDGKRVIVRNADRFASLYGKFMTPSMERAITRTRYSTVMVNSKGVMLGDGQAWISGICKDSTCAHSEVKVIALQTGPEPGAP